MRVLIEASSAYDQYGGIGRYARNVISHMVKDNAGSDEFGLVRTRDRAEIDLTDFERAVQGSRISTIPLSRQNAYRLWFRLGLPIDVQWLAGQADVSYSPDFTLWHTSGVPRIVTVHDLVHLTHPEHTVPGLLRFLDTVVIPQIESATRVAVVSHATASDLTTLVGVSGDKIIYAPNAVDERFVLPEPLSANELRHLGLPSEFSLMLGTIEPRKNHINAIRAYSLSGIAKQVPLVIAGRYGWGLDKLLPAIEDGESRGILRYVSYLDDAILPRVMASARMLLFPSWNEGFGLPVAEMLATGGNVVTSFAPALLEVAGGHGFGADAGDVEGLAGAINAATDLPSGEVRKERSNWIQSQYAWESTATSIMKTLHQLADREGN